VIQARESTADPVAAVEQQVGWEKFVQSVAEAETLAQPENTDTRRELITKYPTIRCFAAVFVEVFQFRGGGAVSNLLKALALISEMYRYGKRTLPLKPPTVSIRRAWRPFVFKDGGIDRRAYELCAFSELRNRLRAGDVWVDRSRQYQDFETYLIPKLTFEMLKAEGPLPVEIETEVQRYLESRRSALTQELATVATLAESGKLPDVDLAEGDLKITPLRALTPPEAEVLEMQRMPCYRASKSPTFCLRSIAGHASPSASRINAMASPRSSPGLLDGTVESVPDSRNGSQQRQGCNRDVNVALCHGLAFLG
jgi:hypothetical protein